VIETSFEVQGVTMAAAGNGDERRALLLVAAVDALWESLGTTISIRFWDGLLERYIGPAAQALGPRPMRVEHIAPELEAEAWQ
jgi:hypothetical protein